MLIILFNPIASAHPLHDTVSIHPHHLHYNQFLFWIHLKVVYHLTNRLSAKFWKSSGFVANITFSWASTPFHIMPEMTVTYSWDSAAGCSNGIGRLCAVTDGAGSTTYSYNDKGYLISSTRTEVGTTKTTQYVRDLSGNLLSWAESSGSQIYTARNNLWASTVRFAQIPRAGEVGSMDFFPTMLLVIWLVLLSACLFRPVRLSCGPCRVAITLTVTMRFY